MKVADVQMEQLGIARKVRRDTLLVSHHVKCVLMSEVDFQVDALHSGHTGQRHVQQMQNLFAGCLF